MQERSLALAGPGYMAISDAVSLEPAARPLPRQGLTSVTPPPHNPRRHGYTWHAWPCRARYQLLCRSWVSAPCVPFVHACCSVSSHRINAALRAHTYFTPICISVRRSRPRWWRAWRCARHWRAVPAAWRRCCSPTSAPGPGTRRRCATGCCLAWSPSLQDGGCSREPTHLVRRTPALLRLRAQSPPISSVPIQCLVRVPPPFDPPTEGRGGCAPVALPTSAP